MGILSRESSVLTRAPWFSLGMWHYFRGLASLPGIYRQLNRSINQSCWRRKKIYNISTSHDLAILLSLSFKPAMTHSLKVTRRHVPVQTHPDTYTYTRHSQTDVDCHTRAHADRPVLREWRNQAQWRLPGQMMSHIVLNASQITT